MIKLKFNKQKIIPDIVEYAEILVTTIIVVWYLKPLIFGIFPFLGTLKSPWDLVVIVFIIYYIKSIINVKVGRRDYL